MGFGRTAGIREIFSQKASSELFEQVAHSRIEFPKEMSNVTNAELFNSQSHCLKSTTRNLESRFAQIRRLTQKLDGLSDFESKLSIAQFANQQVSHTPWQKWLLLWPSCCRTSYDNRSLLNVRYLFDIERSGIFASVSLAPDES